MPWPPEAPQAKTGVITAGWGGKIEKKDRLWSQVRFFWGGWRPNIKQRGIGPTGTERIKVWISVLLFWGGRLPSTYEVRWGVVLDPLLGLRCVQDGWTAPHSRNPPWNSPQSLAVIRRMPRERFQVRLLLTLTHTKATEVTQLPEEQRASLMMFVIKQKTIHLFCFIHSVHVSSRAGGITGLPQ